MTAPTNAVLHYDSKADRLWLTLDRATAAQLAAAEGEAIIVQIDAHELVGIMGANRRIWIALEGGLDVAKIESVSIRRRRRA